MIQEKAITIQATVPAHLIGQVQRLVENGWYQNFDALLADALRRFLESHRAELSEKFTLEDLAWGLYGEE